MELEKTIGRAIDWLIRGHFVVQLLIGLGVGKLVQWIVTKYAQISPSLGTAIWLLTTAVVLWILITVFQKKISLQQPIPKPEPGVQVVATTALGGGTAQLNIREALQKAYNSVLQPEVETSFRNGLAAYPPNEREAVTMQLLATGLISYMYDKTWWSIYKSQLLALQELNTRALRMEDLKVFYDEAAEQSPQPYANYSFEQWLGYMKNEVLVLDQPGNSIGITVRGKDFLKYLFHNGYRLNDKIL